jgi:hypothetical protein
MTKTLAAIALAAVVLVAPLVGGTTDITAAPSSNTTAVSTGSATTSAFPTASSAATTAPTKATKAATKAASPSHVATSAAGAVATQNRDYNSWQQDVVYVYDMTSKIKKADGSQVWPVKAAAERWDDGNPVDFRYTTAGCPKGAQCVIVKQAELAAPTVGVTSIARVGQDIKSVTITLDTTFGRTSSSAKRRNTSCHELGHSLGLKHTSDRTSCMLSYSSTVKYPSRTDVKTLNSMYSWR